MSRPSRRRPEVLVAEDSRPPAPWTLVLHLLVVLIAWPAGCADGARPSPPTSATDDAVHALVLASGEYGASEDLPLVVVTRTLDPADDAGWSPAMAPSPRPARDEHGVAADTWDAFVARRDADLPLAVERLGVANLRAMSLEEADALPRDATRFDALAARHPGAAGLARLSPVGYGDGGRQALVYVSFASGPLAGSGRWFLLDRDGETWRIAATWYEWRS